MSGSTDWEAVKYEKHFEQELMGLKRRRELDPDCKVEDLEAVLKNLYIMDGADQDGRGGAQEIYFSAVIAAYEHFIAAWKAEGNNRET